MLRFRLLLAGTVVAASCTALGFLATPAAHAQFVGQNFQTIDPPFASTARTIGISEAQGISNNSIIAGDYLATDNASGNGYLYQNGNFTNVQYPTQVGTTGNVLFLYGVNSSGVSTGQYQAYDAQGNLISETNFIRSSGNTFSSPTVTGSTYTLFAGINDAGQVATQYGDSNGQTHSAIYNYNTGAFTTFLPDVIAGGDTQIQFVGSNGTIIGQYSDSSANAALNAFVYRNGAYSLFSLSNAVSTRFNGVNAAGIVSGRYIDSNNLSHGLIFNSNNGVFSTLDFPGATETLLRTGSINDSNQIAGTYADADGTLHSFRANIVAAPEPAALALLVPGGIGSILIVTRRRQQPCNRPSQSVA